jgi:hypothetical protein
MWNECPRRKDECGSRTPVPFMENISHYRVKPALGSSVSPLTKSREIDMSRQPSWISRAAFAAAYVLPLSAGSAFASQGPGGGMGTASSLTQMAMAVIVYGASALIVGAGLIGALRRR